LGVLLATVPSLGMVAMVQPHSRVLVVDDDPVICELIAITLADHGYATRRASDGREALHLIELETPDVVLLDVHLPDISGYQLCGRLRQVLGDTMGIMLISGERRESFDRAAGLLLGADDYLVKPFVLDELLARVHRMAQRARPITLSVAGRLTRREAQVLRMLASGMEQKDIAHDLVLAPRTIAKHIEHILSKLGVHSQAQAVALAYRADLATVAGTTALAEIPIRRA
jgi:DNA-binding NarL/FixJ family response regulator